MPRQKEHLSLSRKQYGGTIRLGHWLCVLKRGTLLYSLYTADQDYEFRVAGLRVNERHRHRYELNNRYLRSLEGKGLTASGSLPNGQLVEAVELPPEQHPFFLGTQFHPEYQSWPLQPHPIFVGFIKACLDRARASGSGTSG